MRHVYCDKCSIRHGCELGLFKARHVRGECVEERTASAYNLPAARVGDGENKEGVNANGSK